METISCTTPKGSIAVITHTVSDYDLRSTLTVNGTSAFETTHNDIPCIKFGGGAAAVQMLRIEGELETWLNQTLRPAVAREFAVNECMKLTGVGQKSALKILAAVEAAKQTGEISLFAEKPGTVQNSNGEVPATIRIFATPTGIKKEVTAIY